MSRIGTMYRRYGMLAAVFITGACVLVVEVVATRVLSPYFGNTIYTVSSVITVILAALSVGYYFGGRLADRYPRADVFYGVIFLSGVILAAFYAIGNTLLPYSAETTSLTTGPLLAAAGIFFIPSFLLGLLSPFAVRLQDDALSGSGIGSVSGEIFFWSTAGSILGSLLTGFYLIPSFGIHSIVIGVAAVLAALGGGGYCGEKRRFGAAVAVVAVVIGCYAVWMLFPAATHAGVLYSKDGVYEKISVLEGEYSGRKALFFQQDRSMSGAMFLDTEDPLDMVFDYTRYFEVYRLFRPALTNALVIGGGAFTIPKALLKTEPEALVTVSEIEPSLLDISRRYFKLPDSPRLIFSTEDGRRLLAQSTTTYDLIFSDVYYSLYSIPPHFTTKEFFALSKDRLSENGVFVANLIGTAEDTSPSLILSEMRTFKSVYPNSYFLGVESSDTAALQNVIFIGLNSATSSPLAVLAKSADDVFLRSLPEHELRIDAAVLQKHPLFTDDYAPAEYFTSRLLAERSESPSQSDSGPSGARIMEDISRIVALGARNPTSAGHASLVSLLKSRSETLADTVALDTWVHTEPWGKQYPLTNVIARFNPKAKDRVVLMTHYDTYKRAFLDKEDPQGAPPSANNGASGVAVLLEISRLLAAHPFRDIGLDVIYFDGEEGHENRGPSFDTWYPIGSRHFVADLEAWYPNGKPMLGIDLDMVCDRDLVLRAEAGSIRSARAATAGFWKLGASLYPSVYDMKPRSEIFDDHTEFNKAGVPSFLIADLEYPYYATMQDTPDKCSVSAVEAVTVPLWSFLKGLDGSASR